MWKPIHEAFELEAPVELGIEIDVTDELDGAQARDVFATARREPGRCALLVTTNARHVLGDFDVVDQVRENLARYELEPAVPAMAPPEAYMAEVAARSEYAARPRVAPTLGSFQLSPGPLRGYDIPTAIAELPAPWASTRAAP